MSWSGYQPVSQRVSIAERSSKTDVETIVGSGCPSAETLFHRCVAIVDEDAGIEVVSVADRITDVPGSLDRPPAELELARVLRRAEQPRVPRLDQRAA